MANQVNVSTTTNTVSITPQDTTNVNVGTTNTSVNVTQESTSVVQIQTPGVKGNVGPQGPAQDTGSLLTTASYSNPNLTFTKGDGSTFDVEISGSVNIEGTPANNQVAFFTNSNTIKGNNQFTYIEGTNTFALADALQIISSNNILFNVGNDDQGFQVKGSSDDNLLQVNPQANNKIGIGTSTPGEKLEVIGNISASGDIQANNITASAISGFINSDGNNRVLTSNGNGTLTAENGITVTDSTFGVSKSTLDFQANIFNIEGGITNFDTEVTIDGINGHITASGDINASGNLTANSLTISTSSVRDTYMMFIPGTSDGIDNRASYFLSFNPSTEGLKHDNFSVNFNMSSSVYYDRVIACDDMTIADGKSISITGILHVEEATNVNSRQVQIDLYTASITPNNSTRLPEPLEFTRAFQGSDIAIDVSSPFTSSHHFIQSFDISTLPTNSVIAVALSNSSLSTPVTTNTNVNLSLRLTRNYKKKN